MKLTRFLPLTMAALLVACAVPAGPKPGHSGATTLSQAARDVLKNLPELKISLPKSLSGESGGSERSLHGRSLGETEDLSSNGLPGLKSEAWYDLKRGGGNEFLGPINRGFAVIRDYASSHAIEAGQTFSIDLTGSMIGSVLGMSPPDGLLFTNKMKVVGSDPDQFQIFSAITMTDGNPDHVAKFESRVDVVRDGDNQKLKMYFLLSSGPHVIPIYGYYDTATGACDIVLSSEGTYSYEDAEGNEIQEPEHNYSIQRTEVSSGNVISTVSHSGSEFYSNIRVAYGDDQAGGVASFSTDSGDGDTWYHAEYYDDTGDLLVRTSGDSDYWKPDYADVVNLKTLGYSAAPVTLETRSTYADNAWQYEVKDGDGSGWLPYHKESWTGSGYSGQVSYDGGATWSDSTGSWLQLAFQSTSGDWNGGDALYYWKSHSYADGYDYTTYYQGYVIPTATTVLGKTLYLQYEYPLNRLLPLQEPYTNDYKLIREEGETYEDSWVDDDGEEETWSWTDFSFYLNKNKNGESPIRMDVADGDIDLTNNLYDEDMYYYADGQTQIEKGYLFYTTAALPAYFNHPDLSAKAHVDAGMQSVLANAKLLDASEYEDELAVCLDGPTAGVF